MKGVIGSLVIALTAFASGCGGGGNLDPNPTNLKVAAGPNQTVEGGQRVILRGKAWNQNGRLDSMRWAVVRLWDPNDKSELPQIENGNCAQTSAIQDGDYMEVKECVASVEMPHSAYDARYEFSLNITGAASGGAGGGSASDQMEVSVRRDAGPRPLSADAGADILVKYGDTANLECRSYGGFIYAGTSPTFRWTQIDQSGVGVKLEAGDGPSSGATQNGPTDGMVSRVKFTAPTPTHDVTLTFRCSAVDGLTQQAEDTVNVRLIAKTPLKVEITPVQKVVYPNTLVTLTANVIDPDATAGTEGETQSCRKCYVHWAQITYLENLPVTWINQQGEQAQFQVPAIDRRVEIRFRAYADRYPIDPGAAELDSYPKADALVIVDPTVPLVVYAGADIAATAGEEVTLTAEVDVGGVASELYYAWRQTSGREVRLSNPRSAAPAFQVPTDAEVGEQFGFRVQVSRRPITDQSIFAPGEQDEVVVRVK